MNLDVTAFLKQKSVLDTVRLEALIAEATRQSRLSAGHFIECGVYEGGTGGLLAEILKNDASPFKVFLLDAWQTPVGATALGTADGGLSPVGMALHRGQLFDTCDADVQGMLRLLELDDYCVIKSGWYGDTLPNFHGPFALAHIDCDFYEPVKACLEYLLPRMTSGATIVVDDYGTEELRNFPEVSQAVDEMLRRVPGWICSEPYGKLDHAVKLTRRY